MFGIEYIERRLVLNRGDNTETNRPADSLQVLGAQRARFHGDGELWKRWTRVATETVHSVDHHWFLW